MLIYVHKEQMLQDMEQHLCRHYILVDNNLRILGTKKDAPDNRLTTGFPHQSRDAFESGNIAAREEAPPPPTLR